jgi:hypothetical protein
MLALDTWSPSFFFVVIMLAQDFQPYQTWRMAHLEGLRRTLSLPPTTLPVVYVMRCVDRVICASVPAPLDAQYGNLLTQWWGEDVLAKCTVAQWHAGPLMYYAAKLAPEFLEHVECAMLASEDADHVLATLHQLLEHVPLLILVDVVTHWQQAWLRQDPAMATWGQGAWRPMGVPARLWRYVEQRMAAQSPEFIRAL